MPRPVSRQLLFILQGSNVKGMFLGVCYAEGLDKTATYCLNSKDTRSYDLWHVLLRFSTR